MRCKDICCSILIDIYTAKGADSTASTTLLGTAENHRYSLLNKVTIIIIHVYFLTLFVRVQIYYKFNKKV